jgi:hypothetical protein
MHHDDLIEKLEDQRDRIQRAIQILKSGAGGSRRNHGKHGKWRLSPAARKKISEAQRRRWAAAKQGKVRSIEK